jgi:hypothetical protein
MCPTLIQLVYADSLDERRDPAHRRRVRATPRPASVSRPAR